MNIQQNHFDPLFPSMKHHSAMTSNNFCNNCGKQGHQFHQCKLPITSYGVVLFRSGEKGIQFLMIRRKDSFGYIDVIRGKYSPYFVEQLQNSVDEMSMGEKQRLLELPFDKLWKMMWGDNNMANYRNEETLSLKKFEMIKNGIRIGPNPFSPLSGALPLMASPLMALPLTSSPLTASPLNSLSNDKISLQQMIENSKTQWEETEWEFPKGRRNYQERDIDCALREFEEETGLSKKYISIIENVLPFEEIFIGSNHKSYKHKYFLAYLNENIEEQGNTFPYYQQSEVSKIEWKSYEQCLEVIRPYHLEKKKMIQNIYRVLQEYRFYS